MRTKAQRHRDRVEARLDSLRDQLVRTHCMLADRLPREGLAEFDRLNELAEDALRQATLTTAPDVARVFLDIAQQYQSMAHDAAHR